jgi:hypothetical protein
MRFGVDSLFLMQAREELKCFNPARYAKFQPNCVLRRRAAPQSADDSEPLAA